MRITEMASTNNEDQESPFDMLDLTPETLNTMADTELDQLRETIHEIWRTQGSKDDNDLAIAASIVINNQYMLRGRELPNKDKLDEISETKQKTAITGEDKKKKEKEKFIRELTEVFAKSLPEYDLIIKPKKKEVGKDD